MTAAALPWRFVVLACLLSLAACSSPAARPAHERGFFGGISAWISGADRAQTAALEAEAARSEQAALAAQRRADHATADLARNQGETLAAQRLAQSPSSAAQLLHETSRSLDQVNTQGRQRMDLFNEQDRAFRRGLLPAARMQGGVQEARADLDGILIWMAQAEGIASQVTPAARTAPSLRAPLAELQTQRERLATTATELQRAMLPIQSVR